MRTGKGEISFKTIVSVMSIVSFLLVAQGATMTAVAAEWELWPKGRGEATETGEPASPEAAAAEKAGRKGGDSVFAGMSSGTIGWIAAIGGGILVLAIAAGGGGGGGSSPPTCQQ